MPSAAAVDTWPQVALIDAAVLWATKHRGGGHMAARWRQAHAACGCPTHKEFPYTAAVRNRQTRKQERRCRCRKDEPSRKDGADSSHRHGARRRWYNRRAEGRCGSDGRRQSQPVHYDALPGVTDDPVARCTVQLDKISSNGAQDGRYTRTVKSELTRCGAKDGYRAAKDSVRPPGVDKGSVRS